MPMPDFREDGWLSEGHHPAAWEEVTMIFGGRPGSRREMLTQRLIRLREALRALEINGVLLLDGSYISAKPEPGDFDVLLIGPADIQVRKDAEPDLAVLLDAQATEGQGFSLFYTATNSPSLPFLQAIWDETKRGVPKGCVRIEI